MSIKPVIFFGCVAVVSACVAASTLPVWGPVTAIGLTAEAVNAGGWAIAAGASTCAIAQGTK